MLQSVIAGLIVFISALIVAHKYLPKVMRRRISGVAGRLSRQAGMARLAAWLEADLPVTASCGDGCGSCGGCGPASNASSVPGEFRISLVSVEKGLRERH